jgi:hypothetical protein
MADPAMPTKKIVVSKRIAKLSNSCAMMLNCNPKGAAGGKNEKKEGW